MNDIKWTILGAYRRKFFVRCTCGITKFVMKKDLNAGKTRMCRKCSAKIANQAFVKHGRANDYLYSVWLGIKKRTTNHNSKDYKWYGGRGITICDRWLDFSNFSNDMGERPTNKHSIDRINNDGNYEPGNCRWATKLEQGANTSTSLRFSPEYLQKIKELKRKGWIDKDIAYIFNVSRSFIYRKVRQQV